MKVRLIGLPHEMPATILALQNAPALYVVSVSAPDPCRGDSDEVRVYVELRVHETPGGRR